MSNLNLVLCFYRFLFGIGIATKCNWSADPFWTNQIKVLTEHYLNDLASLHGRSTNCRLGRSNCPFSYRHLKRGADDTLPDNWIITPIAYHRTRKTINKQARFGVGTRSQFSILKEAVMKGGKLQKTFYFFGILLAIVGIVALVVFLVVFLRKDKSDDEPNGEYSK